ncbi:ShlB/FhaC/HecB family hemolysin secretion/activation protein [Providencia sneebia]|uniref:Putative hemolysin activator protein n=1 Tax=Providencia sneebia DSM 19967 TaxID=1141660 RepID=K8WM18_9GAMM|nr:putative hemolysin activator protein [Providencia sneebia DSM 19967]
MKTIYLVLFFGLFIAIHSYAETFIDGASVIAPVIQKSSHQSVVEKGKQPCVVIYQVYFSNQSQLPLLNSDILHQWKQSIEGQCVSESTLLAYADKLNEQLSQIGYITSYIHYPQQALLFGVLNIELITGKLSRIEYQDNQQEHHSLKTAFPIKYGQAFDIYQVNQGLMNLRNTQLIPYQIQIISENEEKNISRIVVNGRARRALKGRLSVESKYSQELPAHTVSNIFMLANPLLLNDFFYVGIERDMGIEPDKKLKSAALFYSLPYHYWLFSLYGGYQENTSYKNIQLMESIDLQQDLRSRLMSLQGEYFFHRTANSITSISIGSQIQTLDLFLEHYRLESQKRFSTYGLVGMTHKRDIRGGNATFIVKYKQGTDWFGSSNKSAFTTAKARIYQFSADVQSLFTFANQPMYHRHEVDVQLSHAKLDPLLERNSITGKFGIRGFTNSSNIEDGGENTLQIKNELGWLTPWHDLQIYGALDLATTSNKRANFWHENLLIGSELGVRGQYGCVDYQFFMDTPLWKSIALNTEAINMGVKLSMTY